MFAQIFSQARELFLFLSALYILPLLFLCAVVVVGLQLDISFPVFTRDPSAIAHFNPFVGVVSSIGVMLWTASATICLFSWAILRSSLDQMKFSTFLLCSGLMTTLLLFDDLFLLHDHIFPRYFGVKEKIVFLVYICLIFFGAVKFKECILETEYLVLIIALGFFGLSVFIDVLQPRIESFIGHWRILFEDGFKLLGIVGWLGYFLRCSLLRLEGK